MTTFALLVALPVPGPQQVQAAGQECNASPIVGPDADDLFHNAVATAKSAQYDSLLAVYGADQLDEMDDELASMDMIGPGEAEIWTDGSDPHDVDEELRVAKETLASTGEVAEIVKTVVQIAEGATPTLHTAVKMRENSGHDDMWSFFIKVYAYNGCVLIGDTSAVKTMNDRYALNDKYNGILELTLAEAATDVSEITDVYAVVKVENCRYGWYSGKAKGCVKDNDASNIKVEFLDGH